ncbi:MAG: GntR family transcriptional regulator [Gammaproteobacteria bacterium]|nr:GntR family transcriptional regulator [Gammaproteobacteria bacterium]
MYTPFESIYTSLRHRICLLDYPPGTVLRESQLASEFGVSRTPIRAVLQKLSYDGLINSQDGVGNIVTEPGDEEIFDIYQMRIKLAEWIGYARPRELTDQDHDIAIALRQRAEILTQKFEISEYWMINHDQHLLISSVIGNSAMRQMWDQLYYRAARMWYQHIRDNPSGAADSLLAETTEVCRAIYEKNSIALGHVQSNYISYGLKNLGGAGPRDAVSE